jgi:purine-binding chemotaxis protein CheW
MSDTRQVCTFFLEGLFFGVEVGRVQEVLRYRPMTRVPGAARGVRGLLNLRGQIVPALELRHCLGLGPRPAPDEPLNVVLRGDGAAVSLLVDEIGDVLEVAEASFERPPETLTGLPRRLIRGAFKLEGRLLLLLDTAALLRGGWHREAAGEEGLRTDERGAER